MCKYAYFFQLQSRVWRQRRKYDVDCVRTDLRYKRETDGRQMGDKRETETNRRETNGIQTRDRDRWSLNMGDKWETNERHRVCSYTIIVFWDTDGVFKYSNYCEISKRHRFVSPNRVFCFFQRCASLKNIKRWRATKFLGEVDFLHPVPVVLI